MATPSKCGALARVERRGRIRKLLRASGTLPRQLAFPRLTLIVVTLGAAACLPRTRPRPDPALDQLWVYSCPSDFRFSARVMPGLVSLRLPTRTAALPQARTPSGTRYAADGLELRSWGETATLRMGSETHADCAGMRVESPWEEARLLGADFRAIGQDPVWSLELDAGRHMRFLIEGSSEVITPIAEPVGADGVMTYRASTGAHTIDVTIRAEACPNPLLGPGFTHSVKLVVDGFPYLGCGRMLGSAPV